MLSIGREQYGYPVTDELACPDGRGRFTHFRTMALLGDPEASIYWTPTTGAHELRGAIRAAWAAGGFERGPLGYPTSDEFDIGGQPGGRRSNVEHGFIDWSAQRGARVRGPVLFDQGSALNPVSD